MLLQEGFVPSVFGAGLVKAVVQPDDGENTMKEMYTTPAAMWIAPGGEYSRNIHLCLDLFISQRQQSWAALRNLVDEIGG